ncbi:ABC-type transport auxiliary lipoprotein family protein [Helicobacter sp. 11S02596-1]|uniref:ABC-type transport auxiliary lipoprotein family protein n=1 Tax=Helicobacter sp. 11S02596-1 TaxID=1476194 RepID=UPI000BA719A3|nr:ABC-type transport auxiliary lipoprotein family protein [Helicobacter sp. 11S02596-1]PAF42133.1 hypothetical protein BJI48_07440 [Helicobacter sp. 11S02596-1]
MKKLAMIILVLMFSGCVSVKLKSELPKMDHYDINTETSWNLECSNPTEIGLMGITSSDIYNTKDILVKSEDGQITHLENQKWVDLPKNMLQNLLMRESQKQCILITTRPFGTNAPKNLISIDILSFALIHTPSPKAEMAIAYKIGSIKGPEKKGIIIHQEDLKDSSGSRGIIEALQSATKKTMADLIIIIRRNQ